MKIQPAIRVFGIFALAAFCVIASPAQARINYHGFYYTEDDLLNIHYIPELSGDNNVVKIDFDHIQSNPQTLADNIRKNKYIGVEMYLELSESNLVNATGGRDTYLTKVKKMLTQDSDLGKLVVDFQIMEEEFTLQRQGYFDNWSVFKDPNFVSACQAKYANTTLNFTNCKDLYLKSYLESFIDAVHSYFPGIPTVIVENSWGYDFNPPSNLDILGLDAYYIPTSSACDATQKALFDSEVTNVLQKAKSFGKPIQLVGALFDDGNYKMLSQCQAQWYLDLANGTPEVTSFNWFLYADVSGVRGIRNYPNAPLDFIKSEGAKIVQNADRPTITSAKISPQPVVANGASTYDISVTSLDIDGVDDIKVQYALINQLYQGPNGGQFRGYLGWSKDGDSVQKYYFPGISGSQIACTGGGTAAKAVGYGETYINLVSCNTTTSGNYRTTVFTVSFNSNFTTPTTNNVVSGWSADAELNRSSWITTDAGFNIAPNSAPTISSATINPKPIAPSSGAPYSIVITTNDADGASDIKVQYALINQLYQGPNGGQFRGYLGWSKDSDSVQKYYFPGISGTAIACTGGGTAAKAVGYGEEYINLQSCSTSVSGNSRTTTFVVTFNSNFTAPLSNNTLSAWSADTLVARSGWQTFENFALLNTKPTITDTSISPLPLVADGKTVHIISVTTTDPDSYNDIKVQYALINQLYQGPNGGQFRGYLGWSKDGDSVQKYYFPGISGTEISCTGGGTAAKAVGYGEAYINLLSCSTTASGNSRTTTFSVTFNTNFTTPTSGNTISGWSADSVLNRSAWVTTATPFSLK